MLFPRLCADGLAVGVRYWSAVPFERIGVREPGGVKAGRSMRVAYNLATGQDAPHQDRSHVVAEVFGLIGPLSARPGLLGERTMLASGAPGRPCS